MSDEHQPRPLLDHLILIGKISRRFGVPHPLWSVIIFIVYYFFPLVLCGFEGVLIGAKAAQQNLPWGGTWLAQHAGSQHIDLPYLCDFTHLLMALVVSIGGAVALTALDEFQGVYAAITEPGLLMVGPEQVSAETRRLNRWIGNRWVVLLFAVIAILCGAALYFDGKLDSQWWGNPLYGPAGLVLAVAIALAIFYGMHSLYLLAVGQHSISRLISNGIYLRLFHPDGSNGFAALGDQAGPLTIVSTPGHTPGCLSFHWPAKKALFVGDVIVTWPRVEAGWAGLTLDMKQNVQSVGKLSDFGDVEIVGVGHGEPIPEGGIEVLKKLREQKV